MAHEPDPQAKATAAKCLQAFLTLQHQKMNGAPGGGQQGGGGYQGPQQQPSGMSGGPGGSAGIAQILNALGGGR